MVDRTGQKKVLRKKSGKCKIRSSSGSEGLAATTASASSWDSSDATATWSASSSTASAAKSTQASGGDQGSVAAASSTVDATTSSTAWPQAWIEGASTSATSKTSEPWSSSTSSSWSAATSAASTPGSAVGLLQISSTACGACPSTSDAPNGAEWWLNCNIDSSGWNPPHVTLNQLVAADLSANGVFSPCAQYIDQFNQAGADTGVPPIMLASFAMQESSCNAGALGKNGEISLMQVTPANCPSGANCWDPYTNIKVASELFKNMVDSAGGNALAAIGAYNGWYTGMTVGDANSAAVCSQRNNLDYLTQFTNGWMQGKSANGLGTYNNMNSC